MCHQLFSLIFHIKSRPRLPSKMGSEHSEDGLMKQICHLKFNQKAAFLMKNLQITVPWTATLFVFSLWEHKRCCHCKSRQISQNIKDNWICPPLVCLPRPNATTYSVFPVRSQYSKGKNHIATSRNSLSRGEKKKRFLVPTRSQKTFCFLLSAQTWII